MRATAIALLATRFESSDLRKEQGDVYLKRALTDRDVIVRLAALRYFEAHQPLPNQIPEIIGLLFEKLSDSALSVRIEAARILNMFPPQMLSGSQRIKLGTVMKEYVDSQMVNADQMGTHMNLALLAERTGDIEEAIAEYRTAIRLDPSRTGPRSNLSVLYERLANDKRYPQKEIAKKQSRNWRIEEEKLIARDAKLLPKDGDIQFRLGLIRYALGDMKNSIGPIKRAVELLPHRTEYRLSLAELHAKLQQWDEAIEQTKILIKEDPDRKEYQQMLSRYYQQRSGKKP